MSESTVSTSVSAKVHLSPRDWLAEDARATWYATHPIPPAVAEVECTATYPAWHAAGCTVCENGEIRTSWVFDSAARSHCQAHYLKTGEILTALDATGILAEIATERQAEHERKAAEELRIAAIADTYRAECEAFYSRPVAEIVAIGAPNRPNELDYRTTDSIQNAAYAPRRAEIDAYHAEKKRIADEAQAAVALAFAGHLADWVHECMPEHAARMDAGLMPSSEVLNNIREAVFTPLASWPRYEKLTADDVACTCEYPDDSCTVSYETGDSTSLTAEQYARLVECRTLMPAATVTPRDHCATRSECDECEIRESLRVAVDWHGRELVREYAL